jgi:hypothetical protein
MRILLCFVIASISFQARGVNSERVLIPVAYTGAGAHGSFWNTEIHAINRSTTDWRTPGVTFHLVCPLPIGCFLEALAPDQIGVLTADDTYLQAPHGMFIYLPEGQPGAVSLWGRVRVSRFFPYGGTDLPLPHEREFQTRPLLLPFVAVGRGPVRTSLRLYGIDVTRPLTVRVRALRRWIEPLPPAAEVTLQLAPGGTYGEVFPRYAELDLQAAFAAAGMSFADIEVVADVQPGDLARIWALVSMTNNETNEVTLVTPK